MKLYHCGRHCWRRTQLLKNQFHKKKVNRAKSKGFIKFEREERGRGAKQDMKQYTVIPCFCVSVGMGGRITEGRHPGTPFDPGAHTGLGEGRRASGRRSPSYC